MDYKKFEIGNYLFEDIYKASDDQKRLPGIWFENLVYTYEDIERSVDYYAHFLADRGVKKGDHVGLLGVNSYNWLIAFYAIVRVGGVAVFINYMARHETLVDLLKDTDCQYLCYGKFTQLIKKEHEMEDLLKETGMSQKNAFSIQHCDLDFKDILQKEAIVPFLSPIPREEDSKRTSYIILALATRSTNHRFPELTTIGITASMRSLASI